MKRTHMSVGIHESWKVYPGMRKAREKHNTACGTLCDKTKATTDPAQVTCVNCKRKAAQS